MASRKMNIVKMTGEYRFFNEMDRVETILPGNYELDWDPVGGACYIKDTPSFTFPEQMFEVDKQLRKQIIGSYEKLGGNLGILLGGYKGQGKSITAKKICEDLGLPVIMITKRIPIGVDFVNFMNNVLAMNYTIFIDEFEKIFDEYRGSSDDGDGSKFHTQDSFLSFMDGAITSEFKRVFILTSNGRVNDKLISRPSRIRYYKNYNFMPRDMYDAIIKTTLKKKKYEEDLRKNLPLVNATVDLLKSIIQEINIHDMPYSAFMEYFNFRPKMFTYEKYILSGDEYKYESIIEHQGEITREDSYIDGTHCKVIDIVGDYIYFKVTSLDSSIRGKQRKDTTYRLKKVSDGGVPVGASHKYLTI